MNTCIYCGLEKPIADFSHEHIFPDRLGGALCSELFKTNDVCRRCNNLLGLFVDAAFIKSWFRTNDDAIAAQAYVDPRNPTSTSPLMYTGILNGLQLPPEDVCEMWVGACGVHYYHIHGRDEQRWETLAGGNPIARHSDPGRVYVLFTTVQPDWIMLSFRSALLYFPTARRYAPGVIINRANDSPEYFNEMDSAAQEEANRILSLPETKNMSTPLNVAFEQRFMAKLALGFGYKILGREYLNTDYAQRLRSALWEQDLQRRADLGLRGLGFLADRNDELDRLVGWHGAYTFLFKVVSDSLVLCFHLPSTKMIQITISMNPELWRGLDFAPYREGVYYIVLPQIGCFAGPISLMEFILHRTGSRPSPELQSIESLRVDLSNIPACR